MATQKRKPTNRRTLDIVREEIAKARANSSRNMIVLSVLNALETRLITRIVRDSFVGLDRRRPSNATTNHNDRKRGC